MTKSKMSNIPPGAGKIEYRLRHALNRLRSWYLFNIRYSWVKYEGFVRVMSHTSFARMQIHLGHNVQFGDYCNVASNVRIGDNVLLAARVCFVGRRDHDFSVPGQFIWDGSRLDDITTVVEDDVWIGHGCTILSGVTIGRGAIVAAGSVVSRNIPPCEIWGGAPAKKIKDRFPKYEEQRAHLEFLERKKKHGKHGKPTC
jgi:chloramphenicol O-acetyltransferase type B